METGRTCRVCVQGVGGVKEGGVEHEVSFSATGTNDQLVAVVETGRLDVTLEHTSLLAVPGRAATVPVHISRGKGLNGPVKVDLVVAPHIRGVRAAPVVIPAGQSARVMTLQFAASSIGPLNMPVTIRAAATDADGPVVGETRLELLPGES
jgi:hypothetical protein